MIVFLNRCLYNCLTFIGQNDIFFFDVDETFDLVSINAIFSSMQK